MASNQTWYCTCVGGIKNMIKYGKTRSGPQRYLCKLCKKTRVGKYTYQAYKSDTKQSSNSLKRVWE